MNMSLVLKGSWCKWWSSSVILMMMRRGWVGLGTIYFSNISLCNNGSYAIPKCTDYFVHYGSTDIRNRFIPAIYTNTVIVWLVQVGMNQIIIYWNLNLSSEIQYLWCDQDWVPYFLKSKVFWWPLKVFTVFISVSMSNVNNHLQIKKYTSYT